MRATTAIRRHPIGFLRAIEARREARRANEVVSVPIPRVILVPRPDEVVSAPDPLVMPVRRPRANRAPLRRSVRIRLLYNPVNDEQNIVESARLVRRGFLRSGREFK